MFEWAIASSLFLSSVLSAYVLTLFLTIPRAPRNGLRERFEQFRASVHRSFATTHGLLALTELSRMLGRLIDLPIILLGVASMLFNNRKIITLSSLVLLLGLFIMERGDSLLSFFDVSYRCVLNPLLNNYVFTVLQLLNVFWGALVPIWNILVTLIRQIIFGTFFILTRCTSSTLTVVSFVQAMAKVITSSLTEVLVFFGFVGGISFENNMIVNTFRFENIVEPVRTFAQFIPESLGCLCSGNGGWLELLYDAIFRPLYLDEVDHAVSHAFNVPISWFQVLFQTLPPFLTYPSFEKVFYHIVSMLWEIGKLLDQWTIYSIETLLQVFRIGGFTVLVEVPDVFLFGTLARGGVTSTLVIEKGLNITQHLLLPFDEKPITDTSYMQSVFSFAKPAAAADAFLVSAWSTVHFILSTLIKLFVLVKAMDSSLGCRANPDRCMFWLDGSCAVKCIGSSTISFQTTQFMCPYEVNAQARYRFNLDAIEELDRSVHAALDSFQDGVVTVAKTRACPGQWDTSFTYRRGDIIAYEEEAYFCQSSRCFYTSLQRQYPDSSCGTLSTCWQKIPYGSDALAACPPLLNHTSADSFQSCMDDCNVTSRCRAFEYFDLGAYKDAYETTDRQCGAELKCDQPSCSLYASTPMDATIYLTKTRSLTSRADSAPPLVFVYAKEGERILNGTYNAFCEVNKQFEAPFCKSQFNGLLLDRHEQFQASNGLSDRSYQLGYFSDLFTTSQSVYLPLQGELLSVEVKKNIMSEFSFVFSRLDPSNQTRQLADPIEGESVKEEDFQLGSVRNTYKSLILPDSTFHANRFVACTGLSLSRALLNSFVIFYEVWVEILWKVIIQMAVDPSSAFAFPELLFGTLYAYDGGQFSRDEAPPCSAPLPLSQPRMGLEDYNGGWKGNGFYHDPYCQNRPNLQTHVFFQLDSASFFASSLLQRETFGKLVFNLLRLPVEFYRISIRTVLDIQSTRAVFGMLGKQPIGCGQDYGNVTGDCTPVQELPCAIGFMGPDCQCNVADPALRLDSECGCIWLPSLILDNDLRATTNRATVHWCGINSMEWLGIILSRLTDSVRNILDQLQTSSARGFPRTPDLCLVEENNEYTKGGKIYEVFAQSLVDRVFGGVTVRGFSSNQQYNCPVEAYSDFACSLGGLVERSLDTILAVIRKIWRNSVAIYVFELDAIDIDLTSEICHLSKIESALASTIVEISPGFSQENKDIKKGLVAVLYSVADLLSALLAEYHTFFLFIRAFLAQDASILEGGAEGSDQARNLLASGDISQIFYLFLSKAFIVLFTFVKQFLEGLALVGAPSLFLQLRDIVQFLEDLVTGGIVPIISQVLYLGIRVIALLFAPSTISVSMIGDIVRQTLNLLASVVQMLLSQAMRLLGVILEAMGIFGKIIGTVIGLICKLQPVLNTITFGAWQTVNCDGLPSVRRRLDEVPMEAPQELFLAFNWTGPSFCDNFVTAMKDYPEDTLRPIETLRLNECLEWRIMSETVRNATHLYDLIPHDIFYNWKAPLWLGVQTISGVFLYGEWLMGGSGDIPSLKAAFEKKGIPANDALSVVYTTKRLLQNKITRKGFNEIIEDTFRKNDPAYKDPENTDGTAKAFRVYESISSSAFGIYDIVTSKKFHSSWREFDSMKVPTPGPLPLRAPQAHEIFTPHALEIGTSVAQLPQTFGRIYTELDCQQSDEAELFCFQCSFFDSFLLSFFDVLNDAGKFYEYSYTEDFIVYFNDSWNENTEYNRRYAQSFKKAQGAREENYGGTSSDWGAYLTGLFAGNRTVSEVGLAVNYFFQGHNSAPDDATLLFPVDFTTILEVPFKQDCTSADFLWKNHKRPVWLGFVPFFIMSAAFELWLFFVTDIPLLFKLSAYGIIAGAGFLGYLVVLYDYNPLCVPAVPTYLLKDITVWFDEEFFLDCACTYFPFLSKQCQQQQCYACMNDAQEYYSCNANASAMNELGVLWHPFFLVRYLFPEALAWAGNVNIFPFTYLGEISGLQVLISQASAQEPISGLDIDCLWFTSLVPAGATVLLFFLAMAVSPILRLITALVQDVLRLLFHVVISTFYLAYATD